MPLDVLGRDVSSTTLLAYDLENHGIIPVPLETLLLHKKEQLDNSPLPSFWYRHQSILPLALLGAIAGMVASGGLAQQYAGSPWPSTLTLAWMSIILVLVGAGVFKVKGEARWEEHPIKVEDLGWLGVPERAADLIREAVAAAPGASLIYGELKQEDVVLDSYVRIERDGESECLVIWDNELKDPIIAIAGKV